MRLQTVPRQLFWRARARLFGVTLLLALSLTPPVWGEVQLVEAFSNLTFTQPLDLRSSPDNSGRIFVVEKTGQIKVFSNESQTSAATVFLDLTARVKVEVEHGLLSMAFSPDYGTNREFYVTYSEAVTGATRISRFRGKSDNALEADPDSEEVLLSIPQETTIHKGGSLAFGPDGHLYISIGDGGPQGDPKKHAQNLRSLRGKILRIGVNASRGTRKYFIPRTNPFAKRGGKVRREIFAYGFRNPWRMSFDAGGNLWAGDVGDNRREEVNIIRRGGNYGWNIREGTLCYQPRNGCRRRGLTPPVHSYERSLGSSITGGYVYRGTSAPSLTGAYLFADYGSLRIAALRLVGKNFVRSEVITPPFLVAGFGEDPNGELLVPDFLDGKIYKFSD